MWKTMEKTIGVPFGKLQTNGDFHIYVSLQQGIHFFMLLIFLLKMQLETRVLFCFLIVLL